MLTTTMVGCTIKNSSTAGDPVISTDQVQNKDERDDQGVWQETAFANEDITQSLEQLSMKDATKYLDALKQQDKMFLSLLMAHAENEYSETDIAVILNGFQLYFDKLEELQLQFEANVQNEDYYIHQYLITGTKDNNVRKLAFQVSYAKSQQWEDIINDNKREPLYDSPLIGRYPYALLDAERYVEALRQEDEASISIHLGMYDHNEESQQTVKQLIQTYSEALSLNTTEIVSKGYDEQQEEFLFELKDANKQMHEIKISSEEFRVIDDWVGNQP